jgi:hypothetical protein
MRERARLLGGWLRLSGERHPGCCVFVRVPLAGAGEPFLSDQLVL